MSVNWLLQENIFQEELEPLIAAIKNEGCNLEYIRYQPFSSPSIKHGSIYQTRYDWPFDEKDCVVFYGSINMTSYIQKYKNYIPGTIASFANFDCLGYYKYFAQYLTNNDYIVMPLSEALRNKDFIFDNYSKGDRVFVRPNCSKKPFTGCVLSYQDFELKNYELGYRYHNNEHLLVLISSPKNIINEYRLFVGETDILGSTSYSIDGIINHGEVVPDKVISFTQNVLNEVDWRPDPVFVVDIGVEDTERVSILELNSFSCSGIYACDPTPIVRRVNEIALKEYVEYTSLT